MSQANGRKQRICSACGEGRLEPKETTQHVEHAGVQGATPLHYAVCDTCGSEIAEAPEARANKRAMTAFRKRADGLLTGSEMRQARQALNLTQAQAAQLFGGGKVAFSRYENDDVTQSEAMDSLIRLCLERPANLVHLAEHKGVPLGIEPASETDGDPLARNRLSAIKQALEDQIDSAHSTARIPPYSAGRQIKVIDIQRWRKSVA